MVTQSGKSRNIAASAVVIGLLGLPSVVGAGDWYLGAGFAQMQTTLDYPGGSEDYTTQHVRVNGGYAFTKHIAIEARLTSSGDDTDIDLFGARYKWQTGTVVSFYAKPMMQIGKFDLYALVGLSLLDTTYELVAFGIKDTETVLTFDAGVGGQYNFNRNFGVSVEAKAYTGTADYPTFFFDGVDISGLSIGAGVTYRF